MLVPRWVVMVSVAVPAGIPPVVVAVVEIVVCVRVSVVVGRVTVIVLVGEVAVAVAVVVAVAVAVVVLVRGTHTRIDRQEEPEAQVPDAGHSPSSLVYWGRVASMGDGRPPQSKLLTHATMS